MRALLCVMCVAACLAGCGRAEKQYRLYKAILEEERQQLLALEDERKHMEGLYQIFCDNRAQLRALGSRVDPAEEAKMERMHSEWRAGFDKALAETQANIARFERTVAEAKSRL